MATSSAPATTSPFGSCRRRPGVCWSSLWPFIRLSRPHFLLGGVLLFAVGAGTADTIDAVGYLVAQVMVTAAQITAHYVNEHADVAADRLVENRTWFSGGSGVLVEELLPPSTALRAAWLSTAVALGAATVVTSYSVPAAVIGFVAIAVSWSYSKQPVRLVASGFGEISATLVVAGAVPLVGSFAQGGTPPPALWWSIAVLIPIHLAMMLSFELPDLKTDAAAGKRVLAVRIGRRTTTQLMLVSLVTSAALAAVAGLSGGLPAGAALAAAAGLIPAALMAFAINGPRYALLTSAGVATLVVVAAGLVVGLQV